MRPPGWRRILVFAADCNTEEAMAISQRILAKRAKPSMPIVGATASVSIGVVMLDGANAEFSRIYRDADHALYHARYEGRRRIGLFEPETPTVAPNGSPAFA